MGTEAGPAIGVQIGVPVGHQQAQPAQAGQDRTQRRELTQAELTRPAGRYPGYHGGAFGQHVREGGVGGQHGCRPGPASAQVMHVHGGAHTAARAPGGFHVLRMPEPTPASRPVRAAARTSSQQAIQEVTDRNSPR